jgi:uncharacterized protein with von Willebrand factor type A (vWA) domain
VSPAPDGSGHLFYNLVLFGRVLRARGLDVSAGSLIDLVRTLEHVSIGRKDDFYHAVRSLVVRRREDLQVFDEAFAAFWRRPSRSWSNRDLRAMGERRRLRRPSFGPTAPAPTAGAAREGVAPTEGEAEPSPAALTYSARETLRNKDFADLTEAELAAVRDMIGAMSWRLGRRRTRRQRPGRGRLLDLRRTLRRNLRYGGEPFVWAHRGPKPKPRPLVVLADSSGSMERYTRLLLLFIYGLAEGLDRHIEAFVFATRLTRITRHLRGRDAARALREVSRAVPDWSGGTRIGEALREFNFRWGRRVLGRGAVVLLISDGWDRGEPGALREEMARLQRSSYRLVWLNPLLGSPGYEPLTRGMQAALPFIDDFLPVHNLASLEELAGRLAALPATRPARGRRAIPRAVPVSP